MRKRLLVLILLMLVFPSYSVYAITDAGKADETNEKATIYPMGDEYCKNKSGEGFYNLGGVFLRDGDATDSGVVESDYVESKEIYRTSSLAKKACDDFVVKNRDAEYLCKDTPSRSAYACNGEIKQLSGSLAYLEKYINGGQMFETQDICLENCKGTCELSSGNSYTYTQVLESKEANGAIELVESRMYVTSGGSNAFCIQPSKAFQCPNYTTEKLIPQYCLSNDFNLNSCKEDYNGDYRCGLAYIALKAAGDSNSLSVEQYAAADMAMRMWAASIGHLAGMKSTKYPLSGEKTTEVNFYSLSGRRVMEDANYAAYGFACNTSARNHGVVCSYQGYETYKEALKLYDAALHVNELDEKGDRIPKLVTRTLGGKEDIAKFTNPTGEECNPGDPGCRVTINLYDTEGNLVPPQSTYCDKNYCYAEYKTESLCKEEEATVVKLEIVVEDFVMSGRVREYRHCTDPTDRQIMFVVDAEGKETTTKTYIEEWEAKVACECADDSTKLESTTDTKKYCANHNVVNTGAKDYDNYEEGYIKDPEMAQILNSCSGENYFREKSYEIDEGETCKIFCRNEITFYLANKEKVYAGMQFRYELEEKLPETMNSANHLTSVVLQQRQCVSEIDYEGWKKRFEEAEKKVAETWNEWKFWHVLAYSQEKYTYYPKAENHFPACSTGCGPLEIGENSSTSPVAVCAREKYKTGNDSDSAADYNQFGEAEVYAYCNDRNSHINIHTDSNGICSPPCNVIIYWAKRAYQAFDYKTGNSKYTLTSDTHSLYAKGDGISLDAEGKLVSGEKSSSNLSCQVTASASCEYSVNPALLPPGSQEQTSTFYSSGSASTTSSKTFITAKTEAINSADKSGYDSFGSTSCTVDTRVSTSTQGGPCTKGKMGDIEYVINNEEISREKYNAAQKKVRDLLTAIQACNMYGSDLEGGNSSQEQDIKYYRLTKKPSTGDDGTTAGKQSGGNNKYIVGDFSKPNGDPTGDLLIIDENTSNVRNVNSDSVDTYGNTKEYKATTMTASPDTEYTVVKVASSANDKSIKKKILKDAACEDDTCVDLIVKYEDTLYGEATEYDKVTGIIKHDDIYNKFCEGDNCYQNQEAIDEEDNWATSPKTEEVKRIVCDISAENPYMHKCELKDTVLPINDYVSFKVTTEVDLYRPKNYYTKVFTGEVVETKANINVRSKQYATLGPNVYPIGRDKENARTGSHKIEYEFTNLGISKFGNSTDTVNLDKYEYECAYEVYNNTTGYDCEVKYDANGNPIPSDCSNFCFYVEDTVPDLECIQWSSFTESKGYGFVYRNVDLKNLFPNPRDFGNNWSSASKVINHIQSTADDIFVNESQLQLSVTLSTDSIKKIREYNRYRSTNSGGYMDESLLNCDLDISLDGHNSTFKNCRSTFIDEIQAGSGVIGIKTNKIVRGGSVIK